MNTGGVMIYVQHLLGIGHLRRIWFLSCALAAQRIKVDLVSGGMPVDGLDHAGVRLQQLPPVRSLDGRFDRLVDEHNQPVDQAWKVSRREALLGLFNSVKPRLLITETFPFGRRMMRFELLPLLQLAKQCDSPPIIVSSVRDILQPKSKPGRNEEILHWIQAYYDKVLIHGDPQIAALDLTFPFADRFAGKLCYTGYIVNPISDHGDTDDGRDEVIVSGGGGAASLDLLRAALAAKPISTLNQRHWRLLVGHNVDEKHFRALQLAAGNGITVERNRDDFATLLSRCSVSVSQAGYNTVMDILRAQSRSVLVPFSEAGELEQSLRAHQLQKRHRAICIDENTLTAEALAKAIDEAATLEVKTFDIDMNGAENSARFIHGWLNAQ